jgi:hypothetical protein
VEGEDGEGGQERMRRSDEKFHSRSCRCLSTSSKRTDVWQQRPDTHTGKIESSFLSVLLLTVIFSPFLGKSILRLFSAIPS